MFTYNDIANLFFVIVNNISYNKLEVEKIVDSVCVNSLGVVFFGEKISSGFG